MLYPGDTLHYGSISELQGANDGSLPVSTGRRRYNSGIARRAGKINAHAILILETYKASPDITLAELQAVVAGNNTEITLCTMSRIITRHGIAREKSQRTRR